MSKVHFLLQGKKAEVDGKKTIADYARDLNINIDIPCGGKGVCGKCKVKVSGEVSGRKKIEEVFELRKGYRLACQAVPLGETYVSLSEAGARRKSLQPRNIKIDKKEGYAVALDLGTTTLAAYLIDTKTGKILKERSKLNPQRHYGDDVITRIANRNNGLYETLKNGINSILEELDRTKIGEPIGIGMKDVRTVCVVGNPTMHHFFLGYDVSGLGKAPYEPKSKKAEMRKAKELGLKWLNPDALIYTPPIISGFIGSDILGGIIASQLHETNDPSMLIDVGTNGEIVLSDGKRVVAASCAMGPAFEGGRIKYGGIAKPGAIEKVKIINGNIFYATIGNEEVSSICGTGIIDVVAELYRNRIIDNLGLFMDHKEDFPITEKIRFSRKDIAEVQQAKAAMQAGEEILLEVLGISHKDLNRIYIAGSFGNYIDKESAKIINLIPNIDSDRIESIGNAAGEGAREMLLSNKIREYAEKIAEKTEYIELMEKQYNFDDRYIQDMFLN